MRRIDPVLYMLLFGIIFFAGVMLLVDVKRPNDGEVFQVLSGLVTGFAGAFFTRLKPQTGPDHPESTTTDLRAGGATATISHTEAPPS